MHFGTVLTLPATGFKKWTLERSFQNEENHRKRNGWTRINSHSILSFLQTQGGLLYPKRQICKRNHWCIYTTLLNIHSYPAGRFITRWNGRRILQTLLKLLLKSSKTHLIMKRQVIYVVLYNGAGMAWFRKAFQDRLGNSWNWTYELNCCIRESTTLRTLAIID